MAGLLTVITIEGAYNYIRCKDPFVNYHESRQEFTLEHYKPANIDMWAYPRLMFGLDQNNNIITNHPRLMYGYFFFFAAIALFMCNRSMLIPVWWMLSVYLWMQFGSMSFTEYVPMHRLETALVGHNHTHGDTCWVTNISYWEAGSDYHCLSTRYVSILHQYSTRRICPAWG